MTDSFYTTSTSHAQSLELDTRPVSVLAFGSQLLSGGVGLNAALPAYIQAAIRVAGVPTLLLSNLPHYPSVQTLDIPAEWIRTALTDLEATGVLDELRVVAVGYLADPAQAYAIAEWFKSLPSERRPFLVLDPTFGDGDVGFYTNPAVVPAIREALVPLADIMTPNSFELRHLTGVELETSKEVARSKVTRVGNYAADTANLVECARTLMTERTRAVILTGVSQNDDGAAKIGNIVVTGTSATPFFLDEVETQSKGLGDTFAAALVSSLVHSGDLDGSLQGEEDTLSDASLNGAVQAAAVHVQQAILAR